MNMYHFRDVLVLSRHTEGDVVVSAQSIGEARKKAYKALLSYCKNDWPVYDTELREEISAMDIRSILKDVSQEPIITDVVLIEGSD